MNGFPTLIVYKDGKKVSSVFYKIPTYIGHKKSTFFFFSVDGTISFCAAAVYKIIDNGFGSDLNESEGIF